MKYQDLAWETEMQLEKLFMIEIDAELLKKVTNEYELLYMIKSLSYPNRVTVTLYQHSTFVLAIWPQPNMEDLGWHGYMYVMKLVIK